MENIHTVTLPRLEIEKMEAELADLRAKVAANTLFVRFDEHYGHRNVEISHHGEIELRFSDIIERLKVEQKNLTEIQKERIVDISDVREAVKEVENILYGLARKTGDLNVQIKKHNKRWFSSKLEFFVFDTVPIFKRLKKFVHWRITRVGRV